MKSIEERFKKLEIKDHILLRPGRYIGAVGTVTQDQWVLSEDKSKFVLEEITFSPGFQKTVDEVVSNVADEAKRNRNLKWLNFTIDENDVLCCQDDGGIPVEIHKEHDQYVPEMIFSEMHAGSNFDDEDESDSTGQNGEGATLTNIFSKWFLVETSDGKKSFAQKHENNMSTSSSPEVVRCKSKYTRITWKPDYERFGMSDGLDAGNRAKIIKRLYDIAACNPKLRVTFNGERIKFNIFREWVGMHTSEYAYDQNVDWQVAVASSSTGFKQISFVNSTEATMGGTHVDYVTNQIVDEIRASIKKTYKVDVKPSNIKNHLTIFINARIINPRYSSQTKENLTTDPREFGTSYEVSNQFITAIVEHSNIIVTIMDWVNARVSAEEAKAARALARKNKHKKVAEHIRANSKNREKCILHLMEGDSAIANFINVRNSEIHGAFPLKGKPKNWRNSKSVVDALKNQELASIMSILGLEIGRPAVNLNYGKVYILADADTDGDAIIGLLMNLFVLWPEMFSDGRINVIRSPIVVCKKKDKTKLFFTIDEWKDASARYTDWNMTYAKGLASLELEEYDAMINRPRIENVVLDNCGEEMLEMVFGDDVAPRKEWLCGEKL